MFVRSRKVFLKNTQRGEYAYIGGSSQEEEERKSQQQKNDVDEVENRNPVIAGADH
jgi:hypothetical protein